MSDTIVFMVVYIFLSLVFGGVVIIYLKRRRERHILNFPEDWKKYNVTVQNNNIKEIMEFGDKVVWNEYLESEHRKKMYEDIKELIDIHPELNDLWKDVHYKYKGIEPTENDFGLKKKESEII